MLQFIMKKDGKRMIESFRRKTTRTSWANARVKLHSQVHFGSKRFLAQKILGPKICWLDLFYLITPNLTWFDLSQLDLTCPDFKFDPNLLNWPILTWLDHSWLDLTSLDLTWPVVTWLDQSWFELTSPDLTWPVLTWLDKSWLDLTSPDFTWPVLTWRDQS